MKGMGKDNSRHSANDTDHDRKVRMREIWREYFPKLVVFTRLMDRRLQTESEDIAQEILLKTFIHLKEYRPVYSFNTWIYRIARNHCIDVLRKCRTAVDHDGYGGDFFDSVPTDTYNPETLYLERENSETIDRCLSAMVDDDRKIAYLSFYEKLGSREIGKILDMPSGTVRYRRVKIRRLITDALEKQNEIRTEKL